MSAGRVRGTEVTIPNDQFADAGFMVPRVPVSTPLVPMFALIIGINDYSELSGFRKLRGAVPDANAVKDYLEEFIRVPEDHIFTLFDSEATRDAIIKAFEDLREDQRIQTGDPIVIYFSGHGGEIDPPTAWDIRGKIQCMVPYDCGHNGIHPIPDRTIGALVEDIAKLKGDNITVIFDCCYSGSGTRNEDDEYVPRSVNLVNKIPADLDTHIWGSRAGSIPPGLAYHGLRSHVLLAACGEREYAFERNGHGQFTTALLGALKETATNHLTYAGVLRRIRLRRQNPRCEGVNQYRTLFDSKVSAGRQVQHAVRSVRSIRGLKYIISAGLAHGVSSGAEFTICSDGKQRTDVIVVDDDAIIEDFQTTLAASVHFESESFAKLTRAGKDVPFYSAREWKIAALLENTLRTHSTNFRLVEKPEGAKLEIAMDGRFAIFNVLDRRVNAFGLKTLPYKVTPNRLIPILSAAAHYFWYLGLANKSNSVYAKQDVTVDFFRLTTDYDDDGKKFYAPTGSGFCQRDPNLDEDIIDFVVDPKEYYGVKITNHTPWDLYVNAFLFNNSSLRITPCYTQSLSSARKLEPPLKRGGEFPIGYGPGGSPPLEYSLQRSQDVDVSFLKVFFATRPIDLSFIEQTTSFVDAEERDWTEEMARRASVGLSKVKGALGMPADVWFAVDVPVVQRRDGK